MELPLLLAGPIVRRADPGLVAVWAAFSRPAEVVLKVWEGRVAHDTTNPVFAASSDDPDPSAPPPRPGAATVRVGEQLHLSLLTVRLPPASAKVFQSDLAYSYNLSIKLASGQTHDLNSLGLLGPHEVAGVPAGPLGYADRLLPSFVLPPSELDHLRIAYGSCRRPSYDDGDALVWLDQHLDQRITDPRARIHQLFLGGDQIYADDVDTLMMLRVAELGVDLIGSAGGTPVERVVVDQVRTRTSTPVSASDPDASYADEPAATTASLGALAAGPEAFPVGHRLHVTQHSAKLTSSDGENHLISFGEFAACYLLVWSPACWGEFVPRAQVRPLPEAPGTAPLKWLDELEPPQDIAFPELAFPERVPQHLFEDAATLDKAAKAEQKLRADPEAWAEQLALKAASRRRSHRVHREFLQGLWRVQRLLANVPTYMIMDDHDLTDDFFLNPLWRHRVLGSALGQSILTNGMLAYALFQDWGNNPVRYDVVTTPEHPELGGLLPGDLLTKAAEVFPSGATTGPDPAVFTTLGRMFGHDLDNQPLPNGRYAAVRPPLSWHFTIDGPRHRAVALDNRTRRSYVAEIGPPGNVSAEALVDQVPLPPLPAGREVLVVVAPLQVIGPPVLDELVSKAIYRIFDAASSGDLLGDPTAGSHAMPGTNPDALETWALEEGSFEHLLARLADYPRVVLLSGDVHNAASNAMTYWRGTSDQPSRFAQFTSSGFKNVMPVYLRALNSDAMLLQQLLRARIGVERFGWTQPADDLVLLPTGRTTDDLLAITRAKLLRSPVLLPAHGWPDDRSASDDSDDLSSRLNPAHLPEWRWRITPLLDQRPEAERPSPIRVLALDEDLIEAQVADPATTFEALQEVARRHQTALARMRNTRQMMFRANFGICRFETTAGQVDAVGEVYTSAVDPETLLPVMDAYMVHRAPLGPFAEPPPGELRDGVIERVPIPGPQP